MNRPPTITRYNQRNPPNAMRESSLESSSGLRLAWLTSFLLATVFLSIFFIASSLGDTARQLAHKIAAASGPGAFALEVTNRSSLDEKSVREVRSALEAELRVAGVHAAKAEQAQGTVEVVLSESLREYVWTAEIVIGSDAARRSCWSRCRDRQPERLSPPPCPIALKNNSSLRARAADPRRRSGRHARRISPARPRTQRGFDLSPSGATPREL